MTPNILATIVIISVAIFCIQYIWTHDIDYFKLLRNKLPEIPVHIETPNLTYGIVSEGLSYKAGIQYQGVKFRTNYSVHSLMLSNNSAHAINDVRFVISFPGGIVNAKVGSVVGCEDVSISAKRTPLKISQGKTVRSIENSLSNTMTLSIARMTKKANLRIDLVIDYRGMKEGYWISDLTYDFIYDNNIKHKRFLNSIVIKSESPLFFYIDTANNLINREGVFATQEIFPFSPIISRSDGSFEQVEDFNGDIEHLKAEAGGALLLSQGVNYQLDTKFEE